MLASQQQNYCVQLLLNCVKISGNIRCRFHSWRSPLINLSLCTVCALHALGSVLPPALQQLRHDKHTVSLTHFASVWQRMKILHQLGMSYGLFLSLFIWVMMSLWLVTMECIFHLQGLCELQMFINSSKCSYRSGQDGVGCCLFCHSHCSLVPPLFTEEIKAFGLLVLSE